MLLDTVTACAAGADPPMLCENERPAAGATVIVPEVTCKTTGMVAGLSRTAPAGPVAVTATPPV
jgi:hypothetical protein